MLIQKLRRWLIKRRLIAYKRAIHTQPILEAIKKQAEPKPNNITDISEMRKGDG